jgi:hypothetical protein
MNNNRVYTTHLALENRRAWNFRTSSIVGVATSTTLQNKLEHICDTPPLKIFAYLISAGWYKWSGWSKLSKHIQPYQNTEQGNTQKSRTQWTHLRALNRVVCKKHLDFPKTVNDYVFACLSIYRASAQKNLIYTRDTIYNLICFYFSWHLSIGR